jgi:riboflavin kinase/FMN adenylyltransferase
MLVYQRAADRPHSPCALAIGSFDGLHVGHKALLARLMRIAAEGHVPSVVYTFDQPTRVLLQGTKYLYTLAEKLKILESIGIDEVVAVPFTREFSLRSKEDFLEELAVLSPSAIVVGDDFRFGHDRSGSASDLQAIARSVVTFPIQQQGGRPVHATLIRDLIGSSDVAGARALLGRPFTARGVVITGDQRGRTIGVPTANVALSEGKIVPPGVFAVRVLLPDGSLVDGVANVGSRPTVDGHEERLEVHLLDFEGDLYGLEVRVDFLAHIRSEQRFTSLDELKAQIAADIARARELLSSDTWGKAGHGTPA